MLVLGVNKILKWCQITTVGRKYTCPTELIDGALFFKFKNQWHSVTDYAAEHLEELVQVGGKVISRPFKN